MVEFKGWDELYDEVDNAALRMRRVLRQTGHRPGHCDCARCKLTRSLLSYLEWYWDDVVKEEEARQSADLACPNKDAVSEETCPQCGEIHL